MSQIKVANTGEQGPSGPARSMPQCMHLYPPLMIRLLFLLTLAMGVPVCAQGVKDVAAPSGTDANAPAEAVNEGDFVLAPNPSSDHVRVLPTMQRSRLYVILYDAQGDNRLSTELLGPTRIDTSTLPEGAYMVTTVDGRGTPLAAHRLLIRR
jgi:hypothetical protein